MYKKRGKKIIKQQNKAHYTFFLSQVLITYQASLHPLLYIFISYQSFLLFFLEFRRLIEFGINMFRNLLVRNFNCLNLRRDDKRSKQ